MSNTSCANSYTLNNMYLSDVGTTSVSDQWSDSNYKNSSLVIIVTVLFGALLRGKGIKKTTTITMCISKDAFVSIIHKICPLDLRDQMGAR